MHIAWHTTRQYASGTSSATTLHTLRSNPFALFEVSYNDSTVLGPHINAFDHNATVKEYSEIRLAMMASLAIGYGWDSEIFKRFICPEKTLQAGTRSVKPQVGNPKCCNNADY